MAVLTIPVTSPRMDFHPDAKARTSEREKSTRVNGQEFLFVNSSSTPSARDARQYKGHRDVRRFVMQKARRARPWSTSKQPERQVPQNRRGPRNKATHHEDMQSSPTPPLLSSSQQAVLEKESTPQDLAIIKTSMAPCEACRSATRMPEHTLCLQCWQVSSRNEQPKDPIADGLFDPFRTLPKSGEMQFNDPDLWHQFCMMASRSPFPVDVRGQSNSMWTMWTTPAFKHPAFLSTLLCSAALHRYAVNRGPFSCVTYLRSKAITEINLSLSDPKAGLSDENIGAVFTLLCVEMALKSPELQELQSPDEELDRVMVHLNGLRRMVDLRGGLGNLRSNKCLESFILRHSILNSLASFDAPYLLPLDSKGDFCHYLGGSIDPSRYRKSKLRFYLQCLDVDSHLVDSLQNVVDFTSCLNEWYSNSSASYDPIDLQNQSSVLQCRLMQWLNDELAHQRRPIDVSLCISFIVFLVLISENFEPELHPMHYRAIPRLKHALLATDSGDWSRAPQLFVWILSVGSICALGSMDYSCYTDLGARAVHECGIESYSALQSCLHDLLWVPFKLDAGLGRLWTNFSEQHP